MNKLRRANKQSGQRATHDTPDESLAPNDETGLSLASSPEISDDAPAGLPSEESTDAQGLPYAGDLPSLQDAAISEAAGGTFVSNSPESDVHVDLDQPGEPAGSKQGFATTEDGLSDETSPPSVAPTVASFDDTGATLQEDVPSENTKPEARGNGTEPLPGKTVPLQAIQEDLSPLPPNAIVDGRYLVQSQLHHGLDRNLYRVTARRQQRCPACGRLNGAEVETCKHCLSNLSDQPPADFYLMAESYRPEALMQDPSMMDLHLYHPNLVPVVDFFSYKPFGQSRYYAVAEPRQGVRLSQMSMPRPGAQVLNWAMQLAGALDYLHSNSVVGAGAEADDILVQGDMASLASLQNAHSTVETEDARAALQSHDLARLAGTMYEAYTGQPAAMSPEGILPMPSGAPAQVGAAFRAAIEPAQGVAPPITAGHWRDQLSQASKALTELERPGRPVAFLSAGLTDVGRVRDQNQDSFGMAEFSQGSVERPMRVGLFVVADGMGGHQGGEIASALALQAFSGEVLARIVAPLVVSPGDREAPSNEAILQGMIRAVQSANERIFKARDNRQNDMGTTIVAALVAGGKAYVVNVGDSRLYTLTRIEDPAAPGGDASMEDDDTSVTSPLQGTAPLSQTATLEPDSQEEEPTEWDRTEGYALTQVSVDHSLVYRLVELGQLDPEEAKVHPHRNFIYRSLGGSPPIEVDTFVRTLRPGDRILICSDGLNSMIEDSQIEDVLATEPDPDRACRRLIDLANEAGGHDNISVIIIDAHNYLPLPEHPLALNNA